MSALPSIGENVSEEQPNVSVAFQKYLVVPQTRFHQPNLTIRVTRCMRTPLCYSSLTHAGGP